MWECRRVNGRVAVSAVMWLSAGGTQLILGECESLTSGSGSSSVYPSPK